MVFSLLGDTVPKQDEGAACFAVDIGCGAGFTAKLFEPNWGMVGVDVSRDALRFCQRRGLTRLCQVDMTRFSLPFKTSSFNLVLALDVIEHIDDDIHALKECQRILKDRGLLIVTVPAFMSLWSPWDEALGHKRRYDARRLSETAQQAALSIVRLTYIFFFVFPAAVSIRSVKKRLLQKDARHYSTDFIPLPRIVNGLLILIGRLEQFLVTKLHWNLPFGLSVISVMTKKRRSQGCPPA